MTIEALLNEGNLTLKPLGRLDSITSPEFEEKANAQLNDEIESVTVDMEQVEFLSSKGLRVLVAIYKKLSGKPMTLINVNSSVMEVLKLSGLAKVFNVE